MHVIVDSIICTLYLIMSNVELFDFASFSISFNMSNFRNNDIQSFVNFMNSISLNIVRNFFDNVFELI